MGNFSNAIFLLEKMKGKMCMTEDGQLFRVESWNIANEQKTEEKGMFGKIKEVLIPQHVSEISTTWTKHIGTTFHSSRSCDNSDYNRTVDRFWECRERFLKMTKELEEFGLEITQVIKEEDDKL